MNVKDNKILRRSGWGILTVLVLLPIIFWIFEMPLSLRFLGISGFTKSLGDVTGLIGMAAFALVMILSARLKIFEKFFSGINDVYVAHHFFGGLALCLLLFHPLLLAYNYISISFRDAALFLLPSTDNWAQNFGIIGLFLMIITLVITFYTKLKYQIWKYTHKFLGVAFIFAVLHTFMMGADISSNAWLKVYFFVLSVLGIIAYFYRAVFAKYLVRTFEYKVKKIKPYLDKIWEIELEPASREIKFLDGQFAFIKIFNESLSKESHPFSFSSAPGNPLKIAIKELGDYTNKISNLRAGDLAEIEGPFGSFSFRNFNRKEQIWIAGGVGITPFLSMLRSLSTTDSDYKIYLYYSVKDDSCLAFKEEIEEIARNNKNLYIIFWITSKKGFLTASVIKNTQNADILICGPGPMMLALKKQFLEMKVGKGQVHTEEFQLY